MQREKLYNVHTKVYFNYIVFVFKKKQVSLTNSCHCEKIIFLREREFLFFILFLLPKMFLKNSMCHKMQREKLYSLQ
jgi:hypothetical protein